MSERRCKQSKPLIILISGPRGRQLQKTLKECFTSVKFKKVSFATLRQPKQSGRRSNCAVDLLRIYCAADKSILSGIIQALQSAIQPAYGKPEQNIWLRLPGTRSVYLGVHSATDAVTNTLLELNKDANRKDRECRAEMDAKLSVVDRAGPKAIQAYKEGRDLGMSHEKAIQYAIEKSERVKYHEVRCAF